MEKYRMLFESVFNKNLAAEDAVDHLEKITAEHPYFPVAQFYLLKLTQKQTATYQIQARKTSALFNNDYWLNFQLLQAEKENMLSPAVAASPYVDHIPEEKSTEPAATQPVYAVTHEFVETAPFFQEVLENISLQTTEASPGNTPEPAAATAWTVPAEPEPLLTESTEATIPEAPAAAETAVSPAALTNEVEDRLAAEETGDLPAEEAQVIEIQENRPVEYADRISQEPGEIKAATQSTDSDILNEEEETAFAESLETDLESSRPAPLGETGQSTEGALPAVAADPTEKLLFEPLHTSDYFASVGIKLSEEEKTGDKLGKQLKSFTDWLKTMKKVHAQQSFQAAKPAGTEATGADSSIQKLAERSNREDEILTEAMAEVLLQQGRQDKAVEILEKLSLLNPSKNAYFAAKINQIKEK